MTTTICRFNHIEWRTDKSWDAVDLHFDITGGRTIRSRLFKPQTSIGKVLVQQLADATGNDSFHSKQAIYIYEQIRDRVDKGHPLVITYEKTKRMNRYGDDFTVYLLHKIEPFDGIIIEE